MAQQLEATFLPLYPTLFPAPLIPLIVSYAWQPSFFTSSELIPAFHSHPPPLPPEVETSQAGTFHDDTRFFDHWTDDLHRCVLDGWRLASITGYAQRHFHGFAATYDHPTLQPPFTLHSPLPSNLPSPVTLTLAPDEQLVNVAYIYTDVFDRLTFFTSLGRRVHMGGMGLTTEQLLTQHTEYGFPLGDRLIGGELGVGRILAFRGGAGKALHSLGCVWQRMYPRSVEERRRTAVLEGEDPKEITETVAAEPGTEGGKEELADGKGWLALLLCCARCWR